MDNPPVPMFKTSAVALSNRGRVDLDGRSGLWRVTVTDADLYLEHGYHPKEDVATRNKAGPAGPTRGRPEDSTRIATQWHESRRRAGPVEAPEPTAVVSS